MEETKFYKAKGYVLGKCWGDGTGMYPIRQYTNDSLSELKAEIKKDFESGALDSGFGFEKLLAASIDVETISSIEVDGKVYHRSDYDESYNLGDNKYVYELYKIMDNEQ